MSKLPKRVKVAMGIRRNFSRGGNVDILLIFFRSLMLQCKWTFTKCFNLSSPQTNCPTKAHAPVALFWKKVFQVELHTSCHPLQLSRNWYINVVIIVNSTQLSLKWTWTINNYVCSSLVYTGWTELTSEIFCPIHFVHFRYQKCFFFS